MYDFSVQASRSKYSVRFVDNLTASLGEEIEAGDYVVIDSNVKRLFSKELSALNSKVVVHEVDASEELKSYKGLEPVIENIIKTGFRRNNRLIAIGGGVVQDVVAFTASVLYRGVQWFFFPTTLLAQADSCIGSKTSINFGHFKNQLGGFYPPSKIMIYPQFVTGLPTGDFWSGIGEMYHYFLIDGKESFEWFNRQIENLDSGNNQELLKQVIRKSLEIKRKMVEKDEFDRKERQIFNYGHSFGHAIESLTNYKIPHGIAVSFGMDMANMVSEETGILVEGVRDEIRPYLARVWDKYSLAELSADDMIKAMSKDKKNAGNQLGLILMRDYGNVFKQQTDKEIVAQCLKEYLGENK